jgi:predicted Zn-dependent protease
LAACNSEGGGGFNAQAFAPIIGERNAHALGAGMHGLNAVTLGERQENAIGESVAVAITNRYQLVPNDNLQRYVMLVGLTVANSSPNPNAKWIFGVIDTPEVNAFSGPNGYVFITRGALMRMRDEAELAGVLAHEVGHVCHHDGLEQVRAAEGRGFVSEGMQAGSGQVAQFAALADAGVDLLTKQAYSQPQELNADRMAVQITSAAGYDPSSYLHFLQRLQQEGSGGAGAGQLMSTHPNIGLRIQTVSGELRNARQGGATLARRFASNTGMPG